tara:strand:+ start:3180 stop:3572 length:393 start_codon:yes stop_codon:yes gene_type:complete
MNPLLQKLLDDDPTLVSTNTDPIEDNSISGGLYDVPRGRGDELMLLVAKAYDELLDQLTRDDDNGSGAMRIYHDTIKPLAKSEPEMLWVAHCVGGLLMRSMTHDNELTLQDTIEKLRKVINKLNPTHDDE